MFAIVVVIFFFKKKKDEAGYSGTLLKYLGRKVIKSSSFWKWLRG